MDPGFARDAPQGQRLAKAGVQQISGFHKPARMRRAARRGVRAGASCQNLDRETLNRYGRVLVVTRKFMEQTQPERRNLATMELSRLIQVAGPFRGSLEPFAADFDIERRHRRAGECLGVPFARRVKH
jgi:hypothetical protein